MHLINQIKINELRSRIVSSLTPLINSDYVLLDIPSHGNIGDQLICEGELLFLNQYIHNHKCVYTVNCHICDQSKISGSNVILLHGGGNFGDIYELHQNFRLKIIQNFPNNRIIVFPQTVHYNNPDKLRKDSIIFNNHSDLYICVRDHVSYNLLAQYVNAEKLLLLPDMAFFMDLSHEFINESKTNKALLMHRIDVESTGSPDQSLIDKLSKEGYVVDVKDWPTYYNTKDIVNYRKYNRYRAFLLNIMSKLPIIDLLIHADTNDSILKRHYIKMGIKFMNQYDIVYTTRLHGLILAILLNKRVTALDNSYGKLSSFYNSWLADFENVSLKS